MKYYVIINGNSSLNIQGLAIESLPNISKPLIRTTREEIDGRDGDIITKLGYSAYDKTLNIGLWGNYDINEVIAFFNQEGVITFSNEPDKYYKFTIVNRIDFVNELEKFKKASITIHCQPFKYQEQPEIVAEEEAVELTGTSFNISDSLEAPLLMDLKGNTSQKTLSGKNLYNATKSESSSSGITYSCDTQYIYLNNTNSSGTKYEFGSTTLPAGTYSLTLELVSGSASRLQTYIYKTGTWTTIQLGSAGWINVQNDSKKASASFTLSEATQISVGSYMNGNVFSNAKVAYQITSGTSSDYNFEPYCGGIPSPNPTYPQNVNVVNGDNQIVVSDGESDTTTYNIDLPVENLIYTSPITRSGITFDYDSITGITTFSGKPEMTYAIADLINSNIPAGTYTLSLETPKSVGVGIGIRIDGGNRVAYPIPANTKSITITTTGTITCYDVYITTLDTSTTYNDSFKLQLEKGNKANSFTPYGTTPIELCKIGTYQDYFYKENDKWYLHKEIGKVVLDGSENVDRVGTLDGSSFRFSISGPNDLKTTNISDVPAGIVICNKFKEISNNDSYNNVSYGILVRANNSKNFIINCDEAKTYTDTQFKNWLTNNNVLVYYVLSSATNTEITYQPLINQLNALEDAESYEGTTNINQVNNDLPFILGLTYFTGDNTITITNDGNIYSKPLLRIKGTSDISISLNGIQIFQITLQNNEIIIIDTEKMEAYYDGILKNRQVIGDYNNFKLNPGENTIEINGAFDYVRISRYSRWV